MGFDLLGRVRRNTILPHTRPLQPLFEAIVNSFHSIEETGTSGTIDILIDRDLSQDQVEAGAAVEPINDFSITDTGSGFTDENFQSFCTSDSTLKLSRGGKGVGRFLWLKAFDYVEISSVFKNGADAFRRSFLFTLTPEGIERETLAQIPADVPTGTTVHLRGFKTDYRDRCRHSCATIGRRIVEHCMFYFLRESAPRVVLRDVNGDSLFLNEMFQDEFARHALKLKLQVKAHTFSLTGLKLPSRTESRHTIHYCAHEREVYSQPLSKLVPEMDRRLHDESGQQYWLSVYVAGSFLDGAVNPERTELFFDTPGNCLPDDLTKDDLSNAIAAEVRRELSRDIEAATEDQIAAIEEYIENRAPEFRPLRRHRDDLRRIPAGLAPDRLQIELYRLKDRLRSQITEKGNEFLRTRPEEIADRQKYEQDYRRYVEELNELGKSDLAHYVIHRRVVLELLSHHLRSNDGRYSIEEAVHGLIFPLKATSDEVNEEQQNLWVIDEKLVYHQHLSSDRPLDKNPVVEVEGGDRPDLLIFNRPFAFSEGPVPHSSIVIVEFKRPARERYKEEDNPFRQMFRYAQKIRAGKAKTTQGRPLYTSARRAASLRLPHLRSHEQDPRDGEHDAARAFIRRTRLFWLSSSRESLRRSNLIYKASQ